MKKENNKAKELTKATSIESPLDLKMTPPTKEDSEKPSENIDIELNHKKGSKKAKKSKHSEEKPDAGEFYDEGELSNIGSLGGGPVVIQQDSSLPDTETGIEPHFEGEHNVRSWSIRNALIRIKNSLYRAFKKPEIFSWGPSGTDPKFEKEVIWGSDDFVLGYWNIFNALGFKHSTFKNQTGVVNSPNTALRSTTNEIPSRLDGRNKKLRIQQSKESETAESAPPPIPTAVTAQAVEAIAHIPLANNVENRTMTELEAELEYFTPLEKIHFDCSWELDKKVSAALPVYFDGDSFDFSVDDHDNILHEFDDHYDQLNVLKNYMKKWNAELQYCWSQLVEKIENQAQKGTFDARENMVFIDLNQLDPAIIEVLEETSKQNNELPEFVKPPKATYITNVFDRLVGKSDDKLLDCGVQVTDADVRRDVLAGIPRWNELRPGEDNEEYKKIAHASEEQIQILISQHTKIFEGITRLQETHATEEFKDLYRIQSRISILLENRSLLFAPLAVELITFMTSISRKLTEYTIMVKEKEVSLKSFNSAISASRAANRKIHDSLPGLDRALSNGTEASLRTGDKIAA